MARPSTVDLDVHGIVGVRLIDPSAHDADRVAAQLGAAPTVLTRQPDIVIEYDDGRLNEPVTFVGLNFAGFSSDGFVVLDRNTGAVDARIPFDDVGVGQCRIVCRRGVRSVPLLMDLVRFAFVAKGCVGVHASAFHYRSTGVLVVGWAKGGKTEMLLSFANHGADYVGDEWVVLSPHGERMFGLPVSIAIRDWHFEHIRGLAAAPGFEHRVLFAAVRLADTIHRALLGTRWRRTFVAKTLGKALPRFRQQLMVRKSPEALFGDRRRDAGVAVDKVVLTVSHSGGDIDVSPADPDEIARRMAASIAYEQNQFFEYYQAFRFAFPDRVNPFLDDIDATQERLLRTALAGKDAYVVSHPYPVAFEALFGAMQTPTAV